MAVKLGPFKFVLIGRIGHVCSNKFLQTYINHDYNSTITGQSQRRLFQILEELIDTFGSPPSISNAFKK